MEFDYYEHLNFERLCGRWPELKPQETIDELYVRFIGQKEIHAGDIGKTAALDDDGEA